LITSRRKLPEDCKDGDDEENCMRGIKCGIARGAKGRSVGPFRQHFESDEIMVKLLVLVCKKQEGMLLPSKNFLYYCFEYAAVGLADIVAAA
jgi:hypothetical protein